MSTDRWTGVRKENPLSLLFIPEPLQPRTGQGAPDIIPGHWPAGHKTSSTALAANRTEVVTIECMKVHLYKTEPRAQP